MKTGHAFGFPAQEMLTSYGQLAGTLLDGVTGVCLLDGNLAVVGQSGQFDAALTVRALMGSAWTQPGRRLPLSVTGSNAATIVAIALETSEGDLLGVFCVQQKARPGKSVQPQQARDTATRLKPVLDCLHRELIAATPPRARVQILTERTAELEWLFNLTGKLKSSADDREVVQELLVAAARRLQCATAILRVPERRLELDYSNDAEQGQALRGVVTSLDKHLLAWAQRHQKPLVINANANPARISARCKILSVPIVREGGRVVGVLAFFNSRKSPDFSQRHVFLARHLGRQAATLVDAQFDLMTGLYTRGGLEQIYSQDREGAPVADGSVIYIDIDRLQVVNEVHGFELGNELIVRVAELVGALTLDPGALSARISGDRFVLVLPSTNTQSAVGMAANLQVATAGLIIGPADDPVDVSVSCGVAALVHMPQGLARALAAAEVACKKAKERGRGRVELYACTDSSMMRSQGDAAAVGRLRAAIKTDRIVLFAQCIVPLQDRSLPGGYEVLMRVRNPNGELASPGELITAAHRYQLLPTVDRCVVRRALEMLTPYRSMLLSRGISMSLNVSGQSIGDEEFVQQFTSQLEAARLPADCVTVEITEQVAVTNLARANDLFRRLRTLGARLALDDFGTGANTLMSLKDLSIDRVKIDGSFVRDIVADKRSQATVRAIVELAKGYGIDTVAEYVESQAIADVVCGLGVDYAQGYAFGRPEPLEQILTVLGCDESHRLHKLFLET